MTLVIRRAKDPPNIWNIPLIFTALNKQKLTCINIHNRCCIQRNKKINASRQQKQRRERHRDWRLRAKNYAHNAYIYIQKENLSLCVLKHNNGRCKGILCVSFCWQLKRHQFENKNWSSFFRGLFQLVLVL